MRREDLNLDEKRAANVWDHVDDVLPVIEAARAGRWNWCDNTPCKYIQLRIDMRDGGCLIEDRHGNRIEPARLRLQRGHAQQWDPWPTRRPPLSEWQQQTVREHQTRATRADNVDPLLPGARDAADRIAGLFTEGFWTDDMDRAVARIIDESVSAALGVALSKPNTSSSLPERREHDPLRGDEPIHDQEVAAAYTNGWNACHKAFAAAIPPAPMLLVMHPESTLLKELPDGTHVILQRTLPPTNTSEVR